MIEGNSFNWSLGYICTLSEVFLISYQSMSIKLVKTVYPLYLLVKLKWATCHETSCCTASKEIFPDGVPIHPGTILSFSGNDHEPRSGSSFSLFCADG